MLLRLILLLTAVPVIELMLLLEVHGALSSAYGSGLGLLVTLGAIIATGVLGASLARREGLRTLQELQRCTQEGRMPTQELANGFMILVGGALLLTPGFLTDLFGFSLLFPGTRALYRKALMQHFQRKVARGEWSVHVSGFSGPSAGPGPAHEAYHWSSQAPRSTRRGDQAEVIDVPYEDT